MDQIQIGKFIAACRKEKGMTQAQLAEKMSVSDRAVSKWETGKNMPDSSIMLDLCSELGITVNDLLNGRRIAMENYKNIAEQTLVEMRESKEKNDRFLLRLEVLIGVTSSLTMFALIMLSALVPMPFWLRIISIWAAIAQFVPSILILLRIEQIAGYYKCGKCGHSWVPTYRQTVLTLNMNRSRYLKCPHCGQRNFHKKVLTKDE